MLTTKKVNPKLAAVRDMLVDAVHEGLTDEKQRNKASFLGVAVSLLRMFGGPEEIETPEEAAAALTELRQRYGPLPTFPDSPYANDDDDDDEQE